MIYKIHRIFVGIVLFIMFCVFLKVFVVGNLNIVVKEKLNCDRNNTCVYEAYDEKRHLNKNNSFNLASVTSVKEDVRRNKNPKGKPLVTYYSIIIKGDSNSDTAIDINEKIYNTFKPYYETAVKNGFKNMQGYSIETKDYTSFFVFACFFVGFFVMFYKIFRGPNQY